MGKIVIDQSRWPLVVLRYPDAFTDDEVRAHLEELRTVVTRKETFGLVSDTGNSAPSVAQRQMFGKFQKDNQPSLKQYCVGNAVVVKSAAQRGVMIAISWLHGAKEGAEFKPFPDVASATAWIQGRLKEAGK